ncbi:MAG: tail fiber domain-containing protein, partial [Flavobacteriales bacterium]|nr:tail fiber domain-containing protein [Flavobacteriales bacterium]
DRSMKKDIEYFNGGILQKVSLLKPATYRYKDNAADAQKAIGFIAQEVEEVFPGLVYEKDGLKTLNYGDFAVLSVAAIQELNAKVEAQSSEIDALRKQLEELTTTVNQLKN